MQAFIDTLMAAEPPPAARAAQRQGSLRHNVLPSSPVAASAPPLDSTLTSLDAPLPARDPALAHARGGSYHIVNSIALLLQQLEALLAFNQLPCELHLNVGLPIAELLQAANAQCQRQVLGAGAMASAGLRSITARHMALCSQCLLLLEVLLPRLRHRALLGVPPAGVAPLASVLDAVSEVRSHFESAITHARARRKARCSALAVSSVHRSLLCLAARAIFVLCVVPFCLCSGQGGHRSVHLPHAAARSAQC